VTSLKWRWQRRQGWRRRRLLQRRRKLHFVGPVKCGRLECWSVEAIVRLWSVIISGSSSTFETHQWPGMSEIEFLTYPVQFRWTEQNFLKYRSQSVSSRSIKKFHSHSFNKKYHSMTRPDWWWMQMNEIYHSISLISLNLIYTDEISINLIQKLKNQHSNGNLAHACQGLYYQKITESYCTDSVIS